MSAGSRLRSFVRALAGRQRLDRDMDDEWTFHLEQRAAALAAAGMSHADADRQARLEFGDRLRWREQGREARGLGWFHDVGADARYALRQMRRTPSFAVVAVAALALGIGANVAIFSIAYALLMRPLPVAEPQRLIAVGTPHDIDESWTYAIWDAFRRRSELFDGAFAFSRQRFDLSERGETEPVEGLYASGDFFSVLGVQAFAGRLFTSADDVHEVGAGPDGPVAVIGYGFWQRRFGGEDVIGRTLRMQRVPFTIIGVTPQSFFGPEVGRSFDVAVPLNTERLVRGAATTLGRNSGNYALRIMLRLKRDQSIGTAAALLHVLQPQIRDESMPATLPPDYQAQFLVEPFTPVAAAHGVSALRGQYQTPLIATIAIVGIVLLITCATLANLLIARATARRHELSVRLALGAGRWRLVRQVLVETLMLSTAGTVLGALLAVWGADLLVQQLSTVDSPVMLDLRPDPLIMLFSALAALLTAIVFGAAPAWRVTRVAPGDMLKAAGRTVTTRGAMSPALVIAQMALSMVLVVASGLFIRTMIGLARLDLGIDSARILLVNVDVARTSIAPPNRAAFISSIIERLGTLPGVESVAASRITPIGGGGIIDEISVTGGVSNPAAESTYGLPRFWNANSSMLNIVTPGWFATYGMTLHRGRAFTDADLSDADPVAIVNEAFVRKFLSDREPLGSLVVHRIGSQKGTQRRVVGVVNDAVYDSLRGGLRPVMFVPLVRQAPGPTTITISVRAAAGRDPAGLSGAVAAALSSLESNLAFSFRSLPERVAATFANERLLAMLSAFFGCLALLLAAIGLYGVTAYSVARRRSEIGIRLALGAGPRRVVRQVLGSVFVLVAIGVIVGAVTSALLMRFVASLLYGLGPHDPGTLASAALVLAAVGAVAGWLPAYRASRVDPAEVLREN